MQPVLVDFWSVGMFFPGSKGQLKMDSKCQWRTGDRSRGRWLQQVRRGTW